MSAAYAERMKKKHGYTGAVETQTLKNENFRKVLYTAAHSQLVLMSLLPREDIGMEVHKGGDQFFRFERGAGAVIINGVRHAVAAGDGVIVPAGAQHNIINTSKTRPLKLYTIYAPPHHRDGIVCKTKEDAAALIERFTKTTE